ncbi:MAG: heavy metal-binding domain-containing protein [Sphingobacteriaceae bacterium]|nr:heavy metal-binding domain-containing protein [Sphingobacteriaceae bacterium]
MKNNTIITTLSFIVIMFFASCGNKTSESKTEKTATEQTENTRYQCPMKCEGEKTYDKPGQCPKCNMDLQKVEEMDEQHNHDSTHTNH